jgi:hypothetical protein
MNEEDNLSNLKRVTPVRGVQMSALCEYLRLREAQGQLTSGGEIAYMIESAEGKCLLERLDSSCVVSRVHPIQVGDHCLYVGRTVLRHVLANGGEIVIIVTMFGGREK